MIEVNGEAIAIETDRLWLRPLALSDVVDAYVDGLNDPQVNEYLVSVKATRQTRESVGQFIVANRSDPAGVLFGLFTKPAKELIGTVRLHAIESTHGTATIGVCVFLREHWGRGYSGEAIGAVSDWALRTLPVRYLEASCYEPNTGSMKAFFKAGFSVAARFEDKYLHDGRPIPVVFLKRVSLGTEEVSR